MSLLEIKNLKIAFNVDKYCLEAVHGISFSLEKGKALGLVGESGCGKSITASAIMKLLPSNALITSGEIFYDNKNILQLSDKELGSLRGKKIALIPQDPMTSLNPLYTIGEQILEAVELHSEYKGNKAKEIVIQSLKDVQIPDAESKYNAYPHQLSGGMRQRAIIAMALSCNSELLIADEPTTALDVTVQAQILYLIKKIQQERNLSLLLISHDLGVVYNVCDEIAVMYSGSIVEQAETTELFKNPKHPYTKALLSALPNNSNFSPEIIEGQPPSLTEIVEGCKFHTRCKYKTDICKTKIPNFENVGDNHKLACFNWNNIN
ncbi:MAG: ABC transporter ATP-binding protein [Candidatus Gastranaerophilales bacterium]|nr:ABC transporter ATP-binding protein [Candidatus Gastranaerophilales bacterium]